MPVSYVNISADGSRLGMSAWTGLFCTGAQHANPLDTSSGTFKGTVSDSGQTLVIVFLRVSSLGAAPGITVSAVVF